MAALVKTNHYRVGYKFPRQKAVNMNYTAETLAMLMRNLQISEGVNRDTVEWLFVHQIMPTGTVLELIAIDGAQGINVTNIQATPKAKWLDDTTDDSSIPFHEKDFNDWLEKSNTDRENKILADVATLLNKAATSSSKPKIVIKAQVPEPKKQRRFIKGFHFSAKPAVATTET